MWKQAALWVWRFFLARLGYLKVPTPTLARVVVVKRTPDENGLYCIGIGPVNGEVVGSVELDDWQGEALVDLIERTATNGQ